MSTHEVLLGASCFGAGFLSGMKCTFYLLARRAKKGHNHG